MAVSFIGGGSRRKPPTCRESQTNFIWNVCVTNDQGYVPLVGKTSRYFPHSWLIAGFETRLTRRVPLVEQELLNLPEHLSSLSVLVGFLLLDLYFRYMFCRSLFVLLYFFFWPLRCLFFFDIRILITPLVSSSSFYHIMLYRLHLAWPGFEHTVVIGTDCTCSCKSNTIWSGSRRSLSCDRQWLHVVGVLKSNNQKMVTTKAPWIN